MHPSRILNKKIEISISQIMIKVEHPQSQQVSKDQSGLTDSRNTMIPKCITKLSQGSEYATQHVILFLKLTGPEAELLPEGVIEAISNLMKVESNPESLMTTLTPGNQVTYSVVHHPDTCKWLFNDVCIILFSSLPQLYFT
ncbi:hypothetical protein O181_081644 [Austropuccinia psidii MF-1]|uniref:Uncharacterized protein n=1 Tax=Austropuccinia psidii MF-1 TaxID=1389203 RepID=A0A9Q3IKB3_9BASI|nr:hypothetical protein [Austropuccinia psidii MF-1]